MRYRAFTACLRIGASFSIRKSWRITENRRNATAFITRASWISLQSRKRYKTSGLVAKALTRRSPTFCTGDSTGMSDTTGPTVRLPRDLLFYLLRTIPAHPADVGDRDLF